MPDQNHIELLFGRKSRIAVLRELYEALSPLSISEIARRSQLARSVASTVLADLERLGIAAETRVAGAKLYSLQRDNFFTKQYILPLFNADSMLRDTIVADMREVFGPYAKTVLLFGSYARGDFTPESDVDLLLIAVDDERKKLLETLSSDYYLHYSQNYGISLNPLVYTHEEARHLAADSPSFYQSIIADGLLVSGDGLEGMTI